MRFLENNMLWKNTEDYMPSYENCLYLVSVRTEETVTNYKSESKTDVCRFTNIATWSSKDKKFKIIETNYQTHSMNCQFVSDDCLPFSYGEYIDSENQDFKELARKVWYERKYTGTRKDYQSKFLEIVDFTETVEAFYPIPVLIYEPNCEFCAKHGGETCDECDFDEEYEAILDEYRE